MGPYPLVLLAQKTLELEGERRPNWFWLRGRRGRSDAC